MIEIRDLHKEFGDVVAVDGVSLRAEPGAIFGLLGPNGAGKSTTIGCICGLLRPTSGHVSVQGHDVAAAPRLAKTGLGVVPQEVALYEDLTAAENVAYWGSAYGMARAALRDRVAEVLEVAGLLDRSKNRVKTFSGGMKRRLNFACGIVHRPKVLLLDEPTVGVDPQSRVRLLELVREEARSGTCVFYTTHYMEEAQDLCDRLAILDRGKILAEGTLGELRRQVGERDLLRLEGRFDPASAKSALEGVDDAEVLHAEEAEVVLSLAQASRKLPAVFAALSRTGAEIRETTLREPSLESLFIKLTGRELRE